MKKTVFYFLVLAIFMSVVFSSCGGSSDSVYWEDWVETEGYVEGSTSFNQRTGKQTSNSTFIEGDVPQDKYIAVRYEHRYTRSLNCTFKVKKIGDDLENNIVGELIEDETLTKRFTIPTNSTYEECAGFIFYCDKDYVYVVNNLYKDNYVEHNDAKTNPQYRFEISISGIQRLTIDMDYNKASSTKPY